MELEKAKKLAEEIVEEMKPWTKRIMIAGSIRRKKANCRDIEICAIPDFYVFESDPEYLFDLSDEPEKENLLHSWAINKQSRIRWIKTGTSEIVDWQPKPDGKYWRGFIETDGESVKLDLFLLNPDNWGVISTIRTGPADFSQALVSFIKYRTRYRVQDGFLKVQETGEIIPCAEEEDFFKNAGLKFVPLSHRERENPYSVLRLEDK